jgi:hypothetical protein
MDTNQIAFAGFPKIPSMEIEEYPSVQMKRRARERIARETAHLTTAEETAYYRRYADNIRQRQTARAHTPTERTLRNST